jgi:hypothetical protein
MWGDTGRYMLVPVNTVERKTTLRIECLRMPGCSLLGPINVYEPPAAAITELVKCLRIHDDKGCENSQNMSYYANLAPLRLRVPP